MKPIGYFSTSAAGFKDLESACGSYFENLTTPECVASLHCATFCLLFECDDSAETLDPAAIGALPEVVDQVVSDFEPLDLLKFCEFITQILEQRFAPVVSA